MLCRDSDHKRLRVRETNILCSQQHHAPGTEKWVLPRFEHPGQPIHRRIRIAAAHRLDESRGHPKVLIAIPVVEQRGRLQGPGHVGGADPTRGACQGSVSRDLERVECHSCIAPAQTSQHIERGRIDGDIERAKAPLGIGQSAFDQYLELSDAQCFEANDTCPRK